MLATRTITIALEAKVSGLVNGLKTASQAANDFGSKTAAFAEQNRQSMEGVGTAGLVAGGVLVAGFGKAVATFASFDKAMSSVQAATHESAENMELLSEAAITAGADTAYSAEEAAGAIEELAKAGVATTDILNGGLDGALSLAAAGNLDVAEAAETAASAMTQFKLKGADIPHIADLLAAGAGKAQGSVHDLGMALNQSGLIASQTGLTIEETTGGLAAFASAGLVGSDAGTSFKTMLQRLNPSSKEAAGLMEELGLSAYDSQGEFIGLSEYAGELQEALQGMSSEQRNAAMNTLFGSDAVRAAAVLYEQGAEGVQKWEDAVNDAGYAAETAALMQDNLAGDLEKLGGAFDTVFLKAGSGANGSLRGLVQTAEDFVDMIGQIPAPALSAAAGIAGVTGAALLGGGAFFTLAPRVFETVGHFQSLSAASPGLTGRLGTVAKGAGVAAAAFIALQIASELAGTGMDDIGTSEEFETAIRALQKDSQAGAKAMEDFATATGSSLTEITGLGHALETVDLNGFLKGMDFVGSGFGLFDTEVGLAKGALKNLDESLAGLASGGNLEAAAEGFRYAAAEGEKVGQSVDKVKESFPDYIEALRTLANETVDGVSEQELLNWAMGETPSAMLAAAAASEETAAALGEVGGEAEAAAVPLKDIVEALFALGMISMSSRDSTAAFHQALRDMHDATVAAGNGSLGLGAILNETATDFDLTTEAGAAANAAFQNIASAGMTDVEAKAREGMGQPELQANLQGTYDALIVAAHGMGIEGAAAEDLARKVFSIPDNADTTAFFHDSAAKLSIQGLESQLNNLDGKTANTYVNNLIRTTYEETTNKIVNESLNKLRTGFPGGATGGRVGDIMGYAAGGQPGGRINYPAPSDLSKDNVLGMVNGKPIALQGREWVINGASSDKYDKELAAINAGTFPMGGHTALSAFRAQLDAGVPASFSGERVGREFSAPAANIAAPSGGGPVTAALSAEDRALLREVINRPIQGTFKVGARAFAEVVAESGQYRARR